MLYHSARIMTARSPLISIIGATGTGKSQVLNLSYPSLLFTYVLHQLAVDLALALNGEVINADAMQLYHGLPIITNQITAEEKRGVKHHLLSILDARVVWHVGRFVKEAERTVRFYG
jgi:tRNA dimethylallyltransferase